MRNPSSSVLQLAMVLLSTASGCSGGATPSDEPSQAKAHAGSNNSTPQVALLDHDTLRAWKPNDAVNGFGAEILIRENIEELSEDQLLSFLRQVAGEHDPVILRVFSSQEAYAAEQDETYGPAYAEGYLLFYVKNRTGRGAYGGRNEVRWMQESGRFAARYGEGTPLNR